MPDDKTKVGEDRVAEGLERRWRQGIAAMFIVFAVIFALVWAGALLLSHAR